MRRFAWRAVAVACLVLPFRLFGFEIHVASLILGMLVLEAIAIVDRLVEGRS